MVASYIKTYPCLKEVAIVLKKFLAVHNFNSPYYGGISSYSVVLLVVAYMNHYDLKNCIGLTPGRLLIGLLEFYGNQFKAFLYGVSVINNGYFKFY